MAPSGSVADIALFWLIAAWVVISLGGLLLLWSLFRDRSRGRRRCPQCWYDMRGVPGMVCPECGRGVQTERQLFRTRRSKGLALIAVIMMAIGAVSLRVPRALEHGWLDAIPAVVLRPVLGLNAARAKELFDAQNNQRARMWRGSGGMSGAAGMAPLTQWERMLVASHTARLLDSGQPVMGGAPAGGIRYGNELSRQVIAPLGREGRVAIGALKRAAWRPSPEITPTDLESLSASMQVDLTGEFIGLAERHGDADIRKDAIERAVLRALQDGRMPERLRRICGRSADDAAAACDVIASPGAKESSLFPPAVASKPPSIDKATSIALVRSLLGSPDPAIQAVAIRCLSPRFAPEFEPDLDAMWARGIPPECATAYAEAMAEYAGAAEEWSPRLVTLIESDDAATAGSAIGTLSSWAAQGAVDRGVLARWLGEFDRAHPAGAPRGPETWLRRGIVETWKYDERHLVTLVRLAATDETESTALLLDVLAQHRFDAFRTRAASLLEGRTIAPDRAHEILMILFDEPTSGYLRHCAMEALAPALLDDPRLNGLIVRALDDSYANVAMFGAELAAASPADERIDARLGVLASGVPESVAARAKRALEERRTGAETAGTREAP